MNQPLIASIKGSSAPPRWLFQASMALIVAGILGLGYVLYQSLLVLEPHNPSGSIFVYFPPDGNSQQLFTSYRIFFVHLPSAMASATVSILMAVGGVLYLISRKRHWESLIIASTQVGLVACFITMATGYFWGDFAWGTGWTWEPRLTSALVLWLSYVALLVVHRSMDSGPKRGMTAAVYGLFTVPLYPLVSKSIEWFGRISHPESLSKLASGDAVNALRSVATPLLLLLFVGLVALRYWQLELAAESRRLAQKIEDREDD